ncbi:hypothetical protein PtB15_11B372 [Puccinia triticina]|nr:hypothetical protein PtB15_11B372 [Puccinia triticina]
MILLNISSRVTYNDQMLPLDYNLFRKMQAMMGVTPDFFKTRITNKRQSWVTVIQVFEYYISHHLTKAFESVFGGVTCLPGCFSMYRLKARRLNDGDWVPILTQPKICRKYSQSVVTTLHQQNLLLLGGGTTLMICTFLARKMMFCPQAKCCTLVPDEFAVLFFVFMELIGTIVLPIAITLTYSLVINSFLHPPKNFSDAIPLILGLPAVLILATSREVSYVFWMLIYLFVLPLYAFWHSVDDFSWGETRKVQGEVKNQGPDSGSKTTFDANTIPHRRWDDWERWRGRRCLYPVDDGCSTVDGAGYSTVHADELGLILDQGEDEPPSLGGLGEPNFPNPAIPPPSARGSPLGFVPELYTTTIIRTTSTPSQPPPLPSALPPAL